MGSLGVDVAGGARRSPAVRVGVPVVLCWRRVGGKVWDDLASLVEEALEKLAPTSNIITSHCQCAAPTATVIKTVGHDDSAIRKAVRQSSSWCCHT